MLQPSRQSNEEKLPEATPQGSFPDLFPLGPTKHQDMFLSHWSLRNILVLDLCQGPYSTRGVVYSIPSHDCPVTYCGTNRQDFFISLPQGAQTGSQKCQLRCCSTYTISGGHLWGLSNWLQPTAASTMCTGAPPSESGVWPACTDLDTGSACTYQFPAKTLNEHLLFSQFSFIKFIITCYISWGLRVPYNQNAVGVSEKHGTYG